VYNERCGKSRLTSARKQKRPSIVQTIKLDHLLRRTDDTESWRTLVFVVPNIGGIHKDDNARAIIVAILLEEFGSSARR